MIFKRLRAIHKNQRGFTLIELVIAIAITSIITGGITMTIFQVFNINSISTNHMIAVRQVQDVGFWVSRDALMAQSTTVTGITGFPITLTWTDYVSGDEYQVVYTLVGGQLQREHYTNYDPVTNPDPDATAIIAQNIDTASTTSETRGSGGFSLPTGNNPPPAGSDQFTITDVIGGDYGTISVDGPGNVVKATPYGGATVAGGSVEVTIDPAAGDVAWATPVAGSYIVVIANSMNASGSWMSTSGNATATITIDTDGDAAFTDISGLVLTITATVGTGSQEASETRTYEIAPRPN